MTFRNKIWDFYSLFGNYFTLKIITIECLMKKYEAHIKQLKGNKFSNSHTYFLTAKFFHPAISETRIKKPFLL
jgi:hypothetical protein